MTDYVANVADSIGAADTDPPYTVTYGWTQADLQALSDALFQARSVGAADTLTATDLASIINLRNPSLADLAALRDAIAAIQILTRSTSDTASFSDIVTALYGGLTEALSFLVMTDAVTVELETLSYLFTPPQRIETIKLKGALRYSYPVSLTVYKTNGQWVAVETPSSDDLSLADRLLSVSGRPEIVDTQTAIELVTAGIGTVTTSTNDAFILPPLEPRSVISEGDGTLAFIGFFITSNGDGTATFHSPPGSASSNGDGTSTITF